jgi:hypothetical protein
MAERDPIETRARANFPNSPACGQWETLLVDALDGLLRPEDESTFSSHMSTCEACTAMFEEARRGREWLAFLAPEPEVPAYLLDRILVETGHGKLDFSKMNAGKLVVAGGPDAGNLIAMAPAWQRPGFVGRMRRFAEPRLLMTAAMAFFSIALTLSLTGVRFSAIKLSDLRPTAVRSVVERRIMTASTPIIRYYDHLRFVYEVESRMKELRRSSEVDQQNQPVAQPKINSNGTGGEGETHKKDGGSKLNPNEAPQQTVNPKFSQWSGDTLEAEELPAPSRNELNQSPRKGFPTPTEASEPVSRNRVQTYLLKTSVLAVPERSKSCLA